MVEFTIKVTWARNFLCGKVSRCRFKNFNGYSALVIHFFFSQPIIGVTSLLNTFNLSCQRLCHIVMWYVIFSYYSLNIYSVYNDAPFIIPDMDHFYTPLFLLNLLEFWLSNYSLFKKSDFCFINLLNYLLACYFFDLHS